jgi:CHASE2 domain-containing sensor protein
VFSGDVFWLLAIFCYFCYFSRFFATFFWLLAILLSATFATFGDYGNERKMKGDGGYLVVCVFIFCYLLLSFLCFLYRVWDGLVVLLADLFSHMF